MKIPIISLEELHPQVPQAASSALIRQAVTAWLTKELAKEV